MKSLVVYYSYSGKTKVKAEMIAKVREAEICEVKEVKKRGVLNAYTVGCYKALKQSVVPIVGLDKNLDEYDRIIVGAPIWNAFPAPAYNSIIQQIPAGKEVELFFTSGSGSTQKSAPKIRSKIESLGLHLVGYTDYKG